jgi:hypothetical protein
MPIVYVAEFLDLLCSPDEPNCPAGIIKHSGFFARPGVSRLVALMCGAVLPLLLVIGAAIYGSRRRWVTVLGLCAAALVLFGLLVDIPVRYYESPAGTEIGGQIAADAIFTTEIDASTLDCRGTAIIKRTRCSEHEFAFVRGAFPTHGVPRPLAVIGGIALPILLILSALFVAVWPGWRRSTA